MLVIDIFRLTTSRKQKIQSILIFIGITSYSFLDGGLVALFYLFISIVVEPEKLETSTYLAPIYSYLNSPSISDFILYFLAFICITFIVKNALALFIDLFTARFRASFSSSLNDRLTRVFLKQHYPFHLHHGETSLRTLSSAIETYTNTVLNDGIRAFSDVLIILSIFAVLLKINPLVTTSICLVVALSLLVVNTYTSKKNSNLSKLHHLSYVGINNLILNIIGGIKEIKLLNREDFFLQKLYVDRVNIYKSINLSLFLGFAPRYIIEASLIVACTFSVYILLLTGQMSQIASVMGSFAIAGFRILPSLNRFTQSINAIKFAKEHFKTIPEFLDLKIPKESGSKKIIKLNSSIELKDIKFSYPGSKKTQLELESLKINKGQSVGIIGKSGSGKTTLVDIILGLLPLEEGSVVVDGINIYDGLKSWQKQIGYVPQSIYISNGTIRQNVAFGMDEKEIDDKAVINALNKAQLAEYIKSTSDGINTEIGERGIRLSGGQKQRIGIARALYHNPTILCLDEATSALDHQTETVFMQAINKLQGQITMIIIAHRLTTVQNCDLIYHFDKGQLINQGNYKHVTKDFTQNINH